MMNGEEDPPSQSEFQIAKAGPIPALRTSTPDRKHYLKKTLYCYDPQALQQPHPPSGTL
jgi:hypothetical protein